MDATAIGTSPVFRNAEGIWQAAPEAQGPFGGMHGGAVAALCAGEMETMAAGRGIGTLVSAHLYLLRPLPLDGISSKIVPVREGGRVAVFENELWVDGKLQAKASACFQQPLAINGLPHAPEEPMFEPETFPKWERPEFFKSAARDRAFSTFATSAIRGTRMARGQNGSA